MTKFPNAEKFKYMCQNADQPSTIEAGSISYPRTVYTFDVQKSMYFKRQKVEESP
jgi:hypothetical protein